MPSTPAAAEPTAPHGPTTPPRMAGTPPPAPSLRDHLLAALAGHPGTRIHHLYALMSVPRRTAEPFPFAVPRPRVWVQDILILLAEEEIDDEEKKEEARPCTPPPAGSSSKPRVLTTGISAALFLIPATASGILYISKVDTTGQARAPSAAAALVRALVGCFADPALRPAPARDVVRHLWVHVFARAQAQYLFSASREWAGKRPLSDTQLCAWWRRALGRVAGEVAGRRGAEVAVRLNYVLPGFSEEEAERALRGAGGKEEGGVRWVYGHPYEARGDVPLPCPQPAEEREETEGLKRKGGGQGLNLGSVIPSFDDDPKSRFMDEIAYTTDGEIRSPQRKKARTAKGEESETGRVLGELGKVSADEFWERMSFRQECVAGAVTGFFTLVVSGGPAGAAPGAGVVGGQTGQVSAQVHKRILTTLLEGVEFSSAERAARATETVEGAIRGLCEGGAEAAPATPRRGRGVAAEAEAAGTRELGEVYGRTATRNAVQQTGGSGAEAVVRVLAVRRKKKQT